jgi:hypothetical protein
MLPNPSLRSGTEDQDTKDPNESEHPKRSRLGNWCGEETAVLKVLGSGISAHNLAGIVYAEGFCMVGPGEIKGRVCAIEVQETMRSPGVKKPTNYLTGIVDSGGLKISDAGNIEDREHSASIEEAMSMSVRVNEASNDLPGVIDIECGSPGRIGYIETGKCTVGIEKATPVAQGPNNLA